MYAIYRFAAILGFALAPAQAHALDFYFTAGSGTLTDTLASLTVTSSAWSGTGTSNAFVTATLSLSTDGMGVSNPTESTPNENANPNATKNGNGSTAVALGNSSGADLVLFSFSRAVNLQSLTLLQIGSDSDLSVWAGTGAFSPSGLLPSALPGSADQFDNTVDTADIRTVDLSAFSGTYDWLAVAARIGHTDDFVKLKSLAVTPVAQPVPDAASWMTMLAGLGLVAFRVNRRTPS